jgi:uncharacterized protein (TIGR03435 family)
MNRIILAALPAMATALAFAQSQPAFEVATVRPAEPLNFAKIAALRESGGQLPLGPHVDAIRALYTNMTLRELAANAWSVKPDQVAGPDWMDNSRFDIVAKMPGGPAQQDAPTMLRALLQDRFKLAVHTANVERSILALVVDKGGPKLKESAETPSPIDDTAPLKPGEIRIETPDGPVIMAAGKAGGLAFRLGANGSLAYSVDLATGAMHTEGSALTMAGFAIILTQSSQDLDDHGPPVIDETGLHGRYQFAVDYQRPDNSPGSSGPVNGPLMEAVRVLGLKLESRKAMMEQLVVDHAEKIPTAN